jgi:hypothetical protein
MDEAKWIIQKKKWKRREEKISNDNFNKFRKWQNK